MSNIPDDETLQVYNARAADYAAMTQDGNQRAELSHFLQHLPSRARLLDLGCGPGRSAARMAQHGHEVIATDASAAMVELAAQHPGVIAIKASFDALPDGPFDGIWANFSLLHAARDDLPRHLGDISRALRPGGLFHIGMKTGEGTHRDTLGRRYTYVTEPELVGLLQTAGLDPFWQCTGTDAGLDGVEAPWICIQAKRRAE